MLINVVCRRRRNFQQSDVPALERAARAGIRIRGLREFGGCESRDGAMADWPVHDTADAVLAGFMRPRAGAGQDVRRPPTAASSRSAGCLAR